MIKPAARLFVIDNSGALVAECINIPKLHSRVGAVPGCLITIAVKKNIFKKNIKKKSRIIVKGQLVKALVVSTVKSKRRHGNFFVSSSQNAVILLNQYLLPYGTRILGPVFREVRQKINFRKVISLARIIV
jgi:large subunit ribosomal protein L14